MKKFDDSVRQKIIELYNEGKWAPEIAEETGVSSQYVNALVRRLGIQRPKPSWEEKTFGKDYENIIKQIEEDYSSGMIMRLIAEKYNVDLNTIRRVLKKAGLSPTGKMQSIGLADFRERDAMIADKKRQGLTYDEIVAEMGVSRRLVQKITHNEGIPVKRAAKNEEFTKQVKELYASGMDTNEIAHKLNARRKRVCNVLGIPFVHMTNTDTGKRNADVMKDIADGMDVKDVAKKYGLTLRTIYFIIEHYNENKD